MAILIRDSDGHKIDVSDPAKIEELKGLGFRIEDSVPAETQSTTENEQTNAADTGASSGDGASNPTPPDLDKMTIEELRTLAASRNLAVNDRTSRAKLISMLQDTENK